MDDTTVLRQRPRKHSRSMSMSMAATRASCTPLSSLLDSSDGLYRYDGPSPVATLVSLRVQVLSYLDDLENRLSQLIPTVDSDEDSDEVDAGGLNGAPGTEELTLSDEVRQWARDGLAMLQHIREDVSSRLPSLIDDATARYDGVKARLPTSLSEMSLPDMTSVSYSVPHLPDWDWKDLPDLRTRLEDVKTAVSDFDLAAYLPTLSARLTLRPLPLISVLYLVRVSYYRSSLIEYGRRSKVKMRRKTVHWRRQLRTWQELRRLPWTEQSSLCLTIYRMRGGTITSSNQDIGSSHWRSGR
jgi:hypothetical protein